MRKLIVTLFVLVLSRNLPPAHADLDVDAKLPADTRLLVRARLSEILRTPLGSGINTAHDDKLTEVRRAILMHIGLDLDRVQDVWLVSCKPDTGVIVLKGDLGAGQIPLVFGESPDVTEVLRDDCPYAVKFMDKKKNKMQLGAVLDEKTVVFGDIPSMNHYLDVVSGRSDALPSDNPQLRAFTSRPDLLAATMFGSLAGWENFDADIAAAIRSIALGVKADNDVQVRLTLEAVDARRAEGFEMTIKGLLILKGESEQLKAKGLLYRLAQRAVVKRQESTLTIDSVLPGDNIKSMVAELFK